MWKRKYLPMTNWWVWSTQYYQWTIRHRTVSLIIRNLWGHRRNHRRINDRNNISNIINSKFVFLVVNFFFFEFLLFFWLKILKKKKKKKIQKCEREIPVVVERLKNNFTFRYIRHAQVIFIFNYFLFRLGGMVKDILRVGIISLNVLKFKCFFFVPSVLPIIF